MHSVFSVLYLVIAMFFMRHFSLSIRVEEDDTVGVFVGIFLLGDLVGVGGRVGWFRYEQHPPHVTVSVHL